MAQQRMVSLFFKYWNDAKQFVSSMEINDAYGLNVIYDKQFDLMINIIDTKNITLDIDELIKNMILAIVDEINEFSEWDTSSEPKLYSDIEEFFELIDILHFIIQLDILAYAKYLNMNLDDIRNNKNKILHHIIPDIEDFEISDLFYTEHDLIQQLSYILEYLPWKHWKTYEKFDYTGLKSEINAFLAKLICMMESYVHSEDILAGYIIKNYENFQRQANGY